MKKNIVIFVSIVLLGGVGTWLILFSDFEIFSNTVLNEQANTDEEDETPGYTITPIPITDDTALPNLEREIQFSSDTPLAVRNSVTKSVAALVLTLKDNPSNAGAWFDLALNYHTVNDYDGAREIWEFLIKVAPNDTTAYENLAKLYHFSIPDFPKSESYFKQSLAINPDVVNPYIGLFELYRYSYKTETSAAADILNQAIVQFPDRLDLVLTLGVYYREQGNVVQARTVLEDGLNKARDANDVSMITAFGVEIERLP